MKDEFIRKALDRGEKGAEWLKAIPHLIVEFQKKWGIKIDPPFNLSYNYVAPATLSNGTHAVIKICYPDDKELGREIDALKVYDGHGIVRLLDADENQSVILMERVEPGISLSELEDDEHGTRILASVMKKLKTPVPANHQFPHIANWAKGIQRLRQRYNGISGPLPRDMVDKAESLFEELIDSIVEPILTHGDLHHDNVLSATREPWLAIDPKGVVAELAYETTAMLRNPASRLKNTSNLPGILKRRIIILSEELEIEPQRIQKWGIAQTMLSAVWTDEDHGIVEESALKIARALNDLDL